MRTTRIEFTQAERDKLLFELTTYYQRCIDDSSLISDFDDPDVMLSMMEGLHAAVIVGELGHFQGKLLLSLVMDQDSDEALAISLENKLRQASG